MVGYDWPVAQYAGIRKNMQINNKFFSTELFHGNFRPLLTYLVLDDDDEEEEEKTLSTFNDALVESKKRLVFDELFLLQLKFLLRKRKINRQKSK